MSGQLLAEIRQFLRALEATQSELTALLGRKRAALIAARSGELVEIAGLESQLADRLRSHLETRRRMLKTCEAQGLPSGSIQELVEAIDCDDRDQLRKQVERARVTSDRLRREGWVHWIIAQRALKHHGEMLELIAHRGKMNPTYSRQPGKETAGGGAILDTSV